MTDLVVRLRNLREVARWPIISEAADEIERLRAELGTIAYSGPNNFTAQMLRGIAHAALTTGERDD